MPWIERVRTGQPLDAGVGADASIGAALLVNYAASTYNSVPGGAKHTRVGAGAFYESIFGKSRTGYDGGSSVAADVFTLPSTTDFTIIALVDGSGSAGSYTPLVGGDQTSNRQFQLRLTPSNTVEFIRFNTAASTATSTTTTTGRTGLVIAVANGLSCKVLHGGKFSATATLTGTPKPLTVVAPGGYLGFDQQPLVSDKGIAFCAVIPRAITDAEAAAIYANPWQLFEKERVFVPVAAGGSSSTITQADGTSTAGTLGGSASAAGTPTAADGTSTAASITASAIAAAGVTSADSTSTVSALAGSAVNAAAITQADGVSTAATLTGTGLADGAAGITPATGTSTTETLAGSSAAVSSFESAAGASAVSALGGASLWEGAFSAAAGLSTCSILVGSDATIVITPGYPDPSTVLVGVSYGPTGVEYTGTFAVPSAASIAAQVRTELAAELLRITEVAKIHGLVQGTDLVVTPTSRVAGDIAQTISGDGVSSSTVSRV